MVFALCASMVLGAQAPKIDLKWIEKGAMSRFTMAGPKTVKLFEQAPPELKKVPDGLKATHYGRFSIGGETKYCLAYEKDQVWLDSDADGDLTDEKPEKWEVTPFGEGSDITHYKHAELPIQVRYGNATRRGYVMAGFQGPADPANSKIRTSAFCLPDFGYEGRMTLGGKTYNVVLADTGMAGDFRGVDEDTRGVRLFVDVNGNGRTETRGEAFDVRRPFNLGGTTYELKVRDAEGNASVAVASVKVAEIPLPADASVGAQFPRMTLKTMDGKEIRLPESYKGKIVMLDIWATWCKPCIAELPGVAKAYQRFKDKGFEVISVTVDEADLDNKVKEYIDKYAMTWTNVYEGRGIASTAADIFAVRAIPFALLIDGDTGKILADSRSLRGEALEPTIEKALAEKKKD